jgi:hypothetical protein
VLDQAQIWRWEPRNRKGNCRVPLKLKFETMAVTREMETVRLEMVRAGTRSKYDCSHRSVVRLWNNCCTSNSNSHRGAAKGLQPLLTNTHENNSVKGNKQIFWKSNRITGTEDSAARLGAATFGLITCSSHTRGNTVQTRIRHPVSETRHTNSLGAAVDTVSVRPADDRDVQLRLLSKLSNFAELAPSNTVPGKHRSRPDLRQHVNQEKAERTRLPRVTSRTRTDTRSP